jgi:beta-lactamase class A
MSIHNWRKKLNISCQTRWFKWLIISILGLSLLWLGFVIGTYFVYRQLQENNPISVRKQGEYKFINPLLECDIQNNSLDNLYIPFEEKLKQSISELNAEKYQNKEFAVYFRDLNNGPWFGINSSAAFTPASLMKVPLLIAYYKQAESDSAILQKKIVLQASDSDFSQNIVTGEKLKVGKEYSIEELINFMIINSDNTAMFNLLNNIDQEKLDKVYLDLGISVPNFRTPEDFMSVVEYASFFRILYNAAYLNENYSEKALTLLSQTKFTDGLVAGVPLGIKVSHKFGERKNMDLETANEQLHECGIVYFPKHPYLLCVMTRGGDFEQMSNFIADTSHLVYKTMSKTYNQ